MRTEELAEFVSKRLKEREADARGTIGYLQTTGDWRSAKLMSKAANDYAALQAVVDIARPAVGDDGRPIPGSGIPDLLAALASTHADHPEYREGWRA